MSEENMPVSRAEFTALMAKLDGIEQKFNKAIEDEYQDRLDKIESSLDEMLKIEAGAILDAENGVEDEEDEEGDEKPEDMGHKKAPKKTDVTSNYTGDATVEDTKKDPTKAMIQDLQKQIKRLEQGQVVIKGAGSSDLEGNTADSYLRKSLAVQYGMEA